MEGPLFGRGKHTSWRRVSGTVGATAASPTGVTCKEWHQLSCSPSKTRRTFRLATFYTTRVFRVFVFVIDVVVVVALFWGGGRKPRFWLAHLEAKGQLKKKKNIYEWMSTFSGTPLSVYLSNCMTRLLFVLFSSRVLCGPNIGKEQRTLLIIDRTKAKIAYASFPFFFSSSEYLLPV